VIVIVTVGLCGVESTVAGQLGFSKYLQSVVATVGEAANFVCHIRSDSASPPQITWWEAFHCSVA